MAYRNLYTPLTQFVDPMSTEISAMLKERYLQSFQAQDQISQSLSELPVASFENDQRMYKDLYASTRGELDAIADRGDYENMLIPVSKVARRYRETATPLAANAKRRQEDIEAKQKMLEAGDITASDYQNWLKRSTLTKSGDDYTPYQGIQFDDAGRVKRDSYYSSAPIAQYVDIQNEILDALNKIPEVKRGGDEIVQYQTVNGMQYAVTEKGQIVEFVPQEAVMAVTQNILRRPDVQAYMTQSSDFATMDLDEQSLDAILAGQAQYLRDAEEDAGAAEVEKILRTGSVGAKRRAAQSIAYNKEASNYLSTAVATRQPSAYGGKFAMKYDDALTKRMEETQLGAYQPVLPGQEHILTNPSVADEAGNITTESVQQSMTTARQQQAVGVETLLEMVPSLAEGLQMNNVPQAIMFEYINSALSGSEGVEQLVQAALLADPNADAATVRENIASAKRAYDYYQADIQMGQQMLRNSYGDFAETAVVNIMSDFATSRNVVADGLPDYMNSVALDANYTYDEESNTIIVQPGQAPTQGSREAANIVLVKNIVDKANAGWINDTLRDAGVDKISMLSEMVQQTLGVDDANARELIAIAGRVGVTYDGAPRGQKSGIQQRTDKMSEEGQALGSQLYNSIRNARTASTEDLEQRSAPSYSFGVTNIALGDDQKGTKSNALNKAMKGYALQNLGNIGIVPTRDSMNKEARTIADLFGENLQYAEIKDVDYTTTVSPSGVVPALVLNVGKTSGAPTGTELPSTVVVPYSDAVLDFFPEFGPMITNATTPGAALINNALGLALNHPGSWSETRGVIMRESIAGRDIEINIIPKVQTVGDDVEVIAGIDRVIVTSTGGGVDDNVAELSQEEFVERYNQLKATQVN